MRCHTPDGSEPDEPLDELGGDDDEPEAPPPPLPRGPEYRELLSQALQALATLAQQIAGPES